MFKVIITADEISRLDTQAYSIKKQLSRIIDGLTKRINEVLPLVDIAYRFGCYDEGADAIYFYYKTNKFTGLLSYKEEGMFLDTLLTEIMEELGYNLKYFYFSSEVWIPEHYIEAVKQTAMSYLTERQDYE